MSVFFLLICNLLWRLFTVFCLALSDFICEGCSIKMFHLFTYLLINHKIPLIVTERFFSGLNSCNDPLLLLSSLNQVMQEPCQKRAWSPTGILQHGVAISPGISSTGPLKSWRLRETICSDGSRAWHPWWSDRLLTSSHRPTPHSEATELD